MEILRPHPGRQVGNRRNRGERTACQQVTSAGGSQEQERANQDKDRELVPSEAVGGDAEGDAVASDDAEDDASADEAGADEEEDGEPVGGEAEDAQPAGGDADTAGEQDVCTLPSTGTGTGGDTYSVLSAFAALAAVVAAGFGLRQRII